MKRMKTVFLLILCLLFLCSCSEGKSKKQDELPDETVQTGESTPAAPESGETEQDADHNPATAGVMEKYREILLGNASFYRAGTDEKHSIYELRSCFTSNETVEMTVISFTVIDLDEDGIDEVVLWPSLSGNEYFGSVILHSTGDEVYGYPIWYRGFNHLKTDGTFHSSGGAGDWGYNKIRFTPQYEREYTAERITYCETYKDENGNQQARYFVNGLEATREDFLGESDKQDAKPDVQKHRYTEENVKKYVS